MKNNKNTKEEKINRKREKVKRRENRKNKKKEEEQRLWDALPSLALLNIFINLNFKDRFRSIPLVCKAWNSVISDDPRCWSSMIPESISPDDAFIKKPVYSSSVNVVSDLGGVFHLRNLIKKSICSSTSTITSLFLDPFHLPYPNTTNDSSFHRQDDILHMIAHCCPNLRHICFDGFYCASIEAVLEVFRKCRKIELINFSDSEYVDSVQVIEELGNCLPNLRGIRMTEWKDWNSIHEVRDAIATHLPRVKLLVVDHISGMDHVFHWDHRCLHCQPLRLVSVYRPRPRLGYKKPSCFECYMKEKKIEEVKTEEAYLEYYSGFGEVLLHYSIMKQKKECEYYVSISKENKKNTRRNHPYVVLRTKMRRNKKEASFISKMKMKKKREKYDYQDYCVPLI